jgi:signal transduction histidine kinase/ActR/RegA family two-component response regulator
VNLKIGRESPGCGFAVSIGKPVITADVTEEPRWKEWLWVAEEYGFRACWSFPVETSAGKVVGSFAMYFKEPRDATSADRELAAVLTQSAAMITSQHLESQERARIAGELEAADRQKDRFLALLGHELRNPLFPISTASELLSRTVASDGRARIAVDIIKRQSAHLTRLVDDLLDIGRITQGRIQLQQMPLELANVIAQALETVEPKLREKHHDVLVRSAEIPLYVDGDFARLVQCLGNVLANAAKYTEPYGKIRIETRIEGETAVISVGDDGVGIAPELLPHVFELFVQGDRTLDRAEGGLGIGLAVVKRLILMHGGDVTAESAGLGKGTTIEIRLPRVAQPQQNAVPTISLIAPPRRVLIVEDNPDAANSLADILSLAGHQTMVVLGGRQALDAIESFQPEVALIDIGLPGISGYELAQRVRANLRLNALRLVAVTGYGQAEDRERARIAGFDEHLVKPVDLATLERTLATVCAREPEDTAENQAARSLQVR